MKAILRRVGRLEDQYAINSSGELRVAVRFIISTPWKMVPGISTCRRTLTAPGWVTEMVELHGQDCQMSEEELDRFVAGFPIQITEEVKRE